MALLLAVINQVAVNVTCTSFCVDVCFPFSWADPQVWTCWIMFILCLASLRNSLPDSFPESLHCCLFPPGSCCLPVSSSGAPGTDEVGKDQRDSLQVWRQEVCQ